MRVKTEGINRCILRLAIPAIINNITVPLLGLCDTAVAGHLGSPAFIGAVSVGAMMINVFFWLCGFLRMGTTGLTANAFGAGAFRDVRRVLGMALSVAAVISLVILIFQKPFLSLLLIVTSPEGDVAALSSQYFSICIWGLPAQLGFMAICGWFIGMQSTLVPMLVAVGMNLVNIGLSLSFVFLFDMGFPGIPLGTAVANWIGLAASLIIAGRMLPKKEEGTEAESKISFGKFFSVNANLFLRSACVMGVSVAVTSIGARLGDITLAANAVVMQFFIFFSYFMDGFAFAGEALVGKDAGSSDRSRMMVTIGALLKWGGGVATVFLIVYIIGSDFIASLLTDEETVLHTVRHLKLWICLLPPLTVLAFLFDGIFIGLTRTREMLIATASATAAFVLILVVGFRLSSPWANMLLWGAFETYLLLRGVLLASIFYAERRRLLA